MALEVPGTAREWLSVTKSEIHESTRCIRCSPYPHSMSIDPDLVSTGDGDGRVDLALEDLEADFLRTGQPVTAADVDRAAARHELSVAELAELFQRAEVAGYVTRGEVGTRGSCDGRRGPRNHTGLAGLDSTTLLLHDLGRYPLLDAKEEIELARSIQAGIEAEARIDESDALARLVERGREAKKRLVACNIRLVVSIARSYREQGLEFPDLVQSGVLGLIRAAEKFDWRKGFKFSTYATWWINQSITRQIANTGRVVRLPVHVDSRVRQMRRASRRLEQRLGRQPRIVELAETLSWDVEEVSLLDVVAQDVLSLDAPTYGTDTTLAEVLATRDAGTESLALAAGIASDVRLALDRLPPRERDVLALRYGLEGERPHTLEEIGQRFSVTRERIRQIEQAAKARLEKILIDLGYGPE